MHPPVPPRSAPATPSMGCRGAEGPCSGWHPESLGFDSCLLPSFPRSEAGKGCPCWVTPHAGSLQGSKQPPNATAGTFKILSSYARVSQALNPCSGVSQPPKLMHRVSQALDAHTGELGDPNSCTRVTPSLPQALQTASFQEAPVPGEDVRV